MSRATHFIRKATHFVRNEAGFARKVTYFEEQYLESKRTQQGDRGHMGNRLEANERNLISKCHH